MKKIITMLLMSVIALGAMAQSPVYRVGDKYMMDGKMMNKQEFKGYLQNTSPEAFQLFNNGYKLSIAGWSCFGVGLALNSVGSAMVRRFVNGKTEKDPSCRPSRFWQWRRTSAPAIWPMTDSPADPDNGARRN